MTIPVIALPTVTFRPFKPPWIYLNWSPNCPWAPALGKVQPAIPHIQDEFFLKVDDNLMTIPVNTLPIVTFRPFEPPWIYLIWYLNHLWAPALGNSLHILNSRERLHSTILLSALHIVNIRTFTPPWLNIKGYTKLRLAPIRRVSIPDINCQTNFLTPKFSHILQIPKRCTTTQNWNLNLISQSVHGDDYPNLKLDPSRGNSIPSLISPAKSLPPRYPITLQSPQRSPTPQSWKCTTIAHPVCSYHNFSYDRPANLKVRLHTAAWTVKRSDTEQYSLEPLQTELTTITTGVPWQSMDIQSANTVGQHNQSLSLIWHSIQQQHICLNEDISTHMKDEGYT